MARNDGGPAFPHDGRDNGPGNIKGYAHNGMTLRDWFAGQALVGVVDACKSDTRNPGETHEQMFARKAYGIADAMIAAREAE